MAEITFTADGDDSEFFIYVIESPTIGETRSCTSEGTPIAHVLALSGVPAQVVEVEDARELEQEIRVGLVRAGGERFRNRVPFLHLSAHGANDGLHLRNAHVPWDDLARWLTDANWEYYNILSVSISACHGLNAFRGALGRRSDRLPFMTLVGSVGEPNWGQSAAAFIALYTQLAHGSSIRTAVAAMRWASRHDEWDFVLGDELVVLGNGADIDLARIREARAERIAALDAGRRLHVV